MNAREMEGFALAQAMAFRLSASILRRLEVGMNEADAHDLARRVFRQEGIRSHWHRPIIGLGEGTLKLRSVGELIRGRLTRRRHAVRQGDLVMIDIAPIIEGFPSDFTLSSAFGTGPEEDPRVKRTRMLAFWITGLLEETISAASVYRWANGQSSVEQGSHLHHVPVIGLGHRLIPIPRSWIDVPGMRLVYLNPLSGTSFLNGRGDFQMQGVWMVEPYVVSQDGATKYEQMVFVSGSERLFLSIDGDGAEWRAVRNSRPRNG